MELSRQQHSFRKGFVRLIWRKFRNKEATRRPPWLTDSIDGRGLCILIFSVGAPSVAMFCCVFIQKFRLVIVLQSSCNISPMVEEHTTYYD